MLVMPVLAEVKMGRSLGSLASQPTCRRIGRAPPLLMSVHDSGSRISGALFWLLPVLHAHCV